MNQAGGQFPHHFRHRAQTYAGGNDGSYDAACWLIARFDDRPSAKRSATYVDLVHPERHPASVT